MDSITEFHKVRVTFQGRNIYDGDISTFRDPNLIAWMIDSGAWSRTGAKYRFEGFLNYKHPVGLDYDTSRLSLEIDSNQRLLKLIGVESRSFILQSYLPQAIESRRSVRAVDIPFVMMDSDSVVFAWNGEDLARRIMGLSESIKGYYQKLWDYTQDGYLHTEWEQSPEPTLRVVFRRSWFPKI